MNLTLHLEILILLFEGTWPAFIDAETPFILVQVWIWYPQLYYECLNSKTWKVTCFLRTWNIAAYPHSAYWLPFTSGHLNPLLIIITVFSCKTTSSIALYSSGYFWTLKFIQNFIRTYLAAFNDVIFSSTSFVIHHLPVRVRVSSIGSMSKHVIYVKQKESVSKIQSYTIFRISWNHFWLQVQGTNIVQKAWKNYARKSFVPSVFKYNASSINCKHLSRACFNNFGCLSIQ